MSTISAEREVGVSTRPKHQETFLQDPRLQKYIPYERHQQLRKMPPEKMGTYIKEVPFAEAVSVVEAFPELNEIRINALKVSMLLYGGDPTTVDTEQRIKSEEAE